MAKKKSGSIAVPYLVTIFIGILIIGGGTFLFMRHLGILGVNKELPEPTPRKISTTTYADNHTILFILDEPKLNRDTTFMLMRSIPKDKKIVFIGIPNNTIALINGDQQSIANAFETSGSRGAVDFAQEVFGIEIDRYMRLESESFRKLCDILGGVTYPVPEDVKGFKGDGSAQYLNSEEIERLLTYSMYMDGESERAYMVGSVAATMMNQAVAQVHIDENLDTSFKTMVNLADTNITELDYRKHKVAIKTMMERGTTIASFLILDGETAYGEFIPSEKFFSDIREAYFSFDETPPSDSEE